MKRINPDYITILKPQHHARQDLGFDPETLTSDKAEKIRQDRSKEHLFTRGPRELSSNPHERESQVGEYTVGQVLYRKPAKGQKKNLNKYIHTIVMFEGDTAIIRPSYAQRGYVERVPVNQIEKHYQLEKPCAETTEPTKKPKAKKAKATNEDSSSSDLDPEKSKSEN